MQSQKKLFTKPRMKELHLWTAGFLVMEEMWRYIDGYDWLYQVSNFGRIKSFKNKKPKILTPTADGIGRKSKYRGITLNNNGVRRFRVHRLVAFAFIPNPENKPFINHKDGNPGNNHVDNLEWCTGFENMQHAVKMGLMNNHFGETHANSKFTDKIVKNILKRLKSGEQQWKIAVTYNVSQSIVSDINTSKSWRHIPC